MPSRSSPTTDQLWLNGMQRSPRSHINVQYLGCGGRGGALPPLVVAADQIRVGAARVGDVDSQQLKADDVDHGITRGNERRVAAELPQRRDCGARTVGGASFALEHERAHRLVDRSEVAVQQLLRLVRFSGDPGSLAQL